MSRTVWLGLVGVAAGMYVWYHSRDLTNTAIMAAAAIVIDFVSVISG
jgi:hypothetical protein